MATLLLVSGVPAWVGELRRHMPELEVRHYPAAGDKADIDYALVWMPEIGLLGSLPNLNVIFSLAAGVDHILRDPGLPATVPIVRMSDPYQCSMMSEYAVMAVLYFHRSMHEYRLDQVREIWQQRAVTYTPDFAVGILGLGDIGRAIAAKLKLFGFQVHGWSRTPKQIDGITCYAGRDGLMTMLPRCSYLICVLPVTAETRGVIDARVLAALPKGACVVNIGRGAHVVDDALLAALDGGHIGGAFLDVFNGEPLPKGHPYWRHPKVVVTPHMAGELLPPTAAKAVVANIRRHLAGEKLLHVYERARGY